MPKDPKYVVCPECQGKGSVLAAAFRGQLCEEYANDPDFLEEYVNGAYDVQCGTCKGIRVVDSNVYESEEAREEREFDREWENEMRRESMMLGEY